MTLGDTTINPLAADARDEARAEGLDPLDELETLADSPLDATASTAGADGADGAANPTADADEDVPAPAVAVPAELPPGFVSIVEFEASGEASPEQLAILEAFPAEWISALEALLDETEDALESVRRIHGPDRDQIVADFEGERRRLAVALAKRTGNTAIVAEFDGGAAIEMELPGAGVTRVQLSWSPGKVVAWAGGPQAATGTIDQLRELLAAAGAPTSGWSEHPNVPLPGGTKAPALVIPVADVLGWLVAVGADPDAADVGPSTRWLGQVAAWAVKLTAQGRMVPLLRQPKRGRTKGGDGTAPCSVRWTPALQNPDILTALVDSMPGAVSALETGAEARNVTQAALTGMVDAICVLAASRLEVPAPPPAPRNQAETAETFLARLDGSKFNAPVNVGAELTSRLERWARPVTTATTVRLIVQLDPPGDSNDWFLSVLADGVDRNPVPVEVALVTAPDGKRRSVEDHLVRLERLLPALRRPGGHRRGQVVLDQDEAWDLMSRTGPVLASAGYDVRVPSLSRKKPTPSLRLSADAFTSESVVGANQLANVRWSAVFDDVELTAAEITKLAAQARPLVRSHGKWVALDHADLAAAAAALAERADTKQLSGAEMLRHALGLEGSPLAGGISIEGNGWAADLLHRAETVSSQPLGAPDGFKGELRSYQAEALAWLGFLDAGGLGGCLALDMGLGKTPTMLAHLLSVKGEGPSLVIAPPAVVGNWAAEAARFTPTLKVMVHHGADRTALSKLAAKAEKVDVVLTTYGTAVRDVEALEKVTWDHLVLDEAQVIKNPASDTAQQLRRLDAKSRLALTGTPIENGLGDLWAILDFTNPGLVGPRPTFIAQLSRTGDGAKDAAEHALRALNGILVFRRTKAEPAIAAELPDRIDELDHCAMTPEQIGLYQAVLDELVIAQSDEDDIARKGQVLAAITALKQICNHPAAYQHDDEPLDNRSGKLARLEEIVDAVFANDEKVLIFTHFATWGQRLAQHLTARMKMPIECYHGGLSRGARDKMIEDFQKRKGAGALILSLKAGGTGLNLTAASHVVLYDRWWNPAVEDQARDRAWRIGQNRTVICHRLVCPGTVDERVEEVVAGKRRIAELVLPKSSSLGDLDAEQLRTALGLRTDQLLVDDDPPLDGGATDDAGGDLAVAAAGREGSAA